MYQRKSQQSQPNFISDAATFLWADQYKISEKLEMKIGEDNQDQIRDKIQSTGVTENEPL